MKVPTDREVFDRQSAIFWFDDEGVLNVLAKSTPRTLEMVKASIELLKTLLNGRKVCCLYDISSASAFDKEPGIT